MSKTISLGDLQLAIMHELWRRGEATVTEVHKALSERDLAHTTIATMLTKLEQRGVVTHRNEGRKYVYSPCVSQGEVRRSMVSELKDRLFGGNTTALVSHLIDEHEVDEQELKRLRMLLSDREEEQ